MRFMSEKDRRTNQQRNVTTLQTGWCMYLPDVPVPSTRDVCNWDVSGFASRNSRHFRASRGDARYWPKCDPLRRAYSRLWARDALSAVLGASFAWSDSNLRGGSISMGRPANSTPRIVVEDCEILNVTSTSTCRGLGFQFDTVPTRGRGRRWCLLCPCCGYRVFKLYRPSHLPTFACRSCHNLSTQLNKYDNV